MNYRLMTKTVCVANQMNESTRAWMPMFQSLATVRVLWGLSQDCRSLGAKPPFQGNSRTASEERLGALVVWRIGQDSFTNRPAQRAEFRQHQTNCLLNRAPQRAAKLGSMRVPCRVSPRSPEFFSPILSCCLIGIYMRAVGRVSKALQPWHCRCFNAEP
jgi:hypothetical protein